jgi:cytochrome bd-type quinol oxidase subunit 1
MDVDALLLARIQFAFTISFHIIFPALTIGLASYLAVLEGLWLKTKRQVYLDLYHFWVKAFAVAFGMGGRLRPCDGLPVRHQLEWLLEICWRRHGSIARL